MHLAKEAEQSAVGVDDGGRVVIDPGRPPLEQRSDDNHAGLAGNLAQPLGGWSRNRLGEIE